MKKLLILPVAVALTIGLASCASGNTNENHPTKTATSKVTATPTPTFTTSTPKPDPNATNAPVAQVDNSATDKVDIINQYQTLLTSAYALNTTEAEAIDTDQSASDLASAYQKDVPDSKNVDITGANENTQKMFYIHLLKLAGTGEATVTVPYNAVTVTGNTATVTANKIVVTVKGKNLSTGSATGPIKLVKKNNKWLFTADSDLSLRS